MTLTVAPITILSGTDGQMPVVVDVRVCGDVLELVPFAHPGFVAAAKRAGHRKAGRWAWRTPGPGFVPPARYPWKMRTVEDRAVVCPAGKRDPQVAGLPVVLGEVTVVPDGLLARVVEGLRARHVPVVSSTPAAVNRRLRDQAHAVHVDLDPAAAGRIVCSPGYQLDRPAGGWPDPVDAAGLDDVVAGVEDAGKVVVSAMAETAWRLSTGTGLSRTGAGGVLCWWQDRFVAAWSATSTSGFCCALPPGAGKTVAVAAAIEGSVGAEHRWLVVAPGTVLGQWRDELARWAPAVQVASGVPGPVDGPTVVLVADTDLAECAGEMAGLWWDALVVDEGDWLRNVRSKRSTAAWAVRASAGRAVVLSGTPERTGGDDLARLVSFAAGRTVRGADRGALGGWVHGDDLTRADLGGGTVKVDVVPWGPSAATVEAASVLHDRFGVVVEDLRRALECRSDGTSAAARLSRQRAAQAQIRLSGVARAVRNWCAAPWETSSELLGEVSAVDGRDRLDVVVDAVRGSDGPVVVLGESTAAISALTGRLAEAFVLPAPGPARDERVAAWAAGEGGVLVAGARDGRGVNLQAAGTLVHVDAALSSADAVQRLGRVCRLGRSGSLRVVHVPGPAGWFDAALVGLFDPLSGVPAVTGGDGITGVVDAALRWTQRSGV